MNIFYTKFRLQTLRYEYHLKLYQLLNHQVVELPDQPADTSIVHLYIETTEKNPQICF
jgi:hypothetical protein